MIRRRRPVREVPFSLDSFLDVIANVIGVIVRLILVAWVGARSYHALLERQPKTDPARPAACADDALPVTLARQGAELDRAEQRLVEQLRALEQAQAGTAQARQQVAQLSEQERHFDQARAALAVTEQQQQAAAKDVQLHLAELRPRLEKLTSDLAAVEKAPAAKQVLRYRTPVSRVVHSEELHFECLGGRVAFIDLAALVGELRRDVLDHSHALRTQGKWDGVAGPLGAFELRYKTELEPGQQGSVAVWWTVVPVAARRGEAVEAALTPGSAFRAVVDRLDPKQSVATFWVYPDSFATYRHLRDYLHQREVEVAGRPLPEGVPIASSPQGKKSRGQ